MKAEDFPPDSAAPEVSVKLPSGLSLAWKKVNIPEPFLDVSPFLGARSSGYFIAVYDLVVKNDGDYDVCFGLRGASVIRIDGTAVASGAAPGSGIIVDGRFAHVSLTAGKHRGMILFDASRSNPLLSVRLVDCLELGGVSPLTPEILSVKGVYGQALGLRSVLRKIGDDPGWAAPGYDDSSWERISKLSIPSKEVLEAAGTSVVWFRFPLEVHAPKGIPPIQLTAAGLGSNRIKVYANAQVLDSLPDLGASFPPFPKQFFFPPEKVNIAVRVEVAPFFPYPDKDRAFWMVARDYHVALNEYNDHVKSENGYAAHRIVLIALFAVYLLFHAPLYFYYPKRRENLFFSLTLFFAMFGILCLHISDTTTNLDLWKITYSYGFLFSMPLSLVCGLALFQLTVMGRIGRTIYFYLALALVCGFMGSQYKNDYAHIYPLLITPEIIRLVLIISKRRRNGFWILSSVLVLISTGIVINAMGSVFNWPESSGFLRYAPWYLFAVFVQGMSVYLAREFARTSMRLEQFAASLEDQVTRRTHELDEEVSVRSKAEASLAESLGLLRAALESVIEGVLVLDNDRQVVVVNERFRQIWNIPPNWEKENNPAVRRTSILRQTEDPDGLNRALDRMLQPGSETISETVHLKDGRVLECIALPYLIGDEVSGRLLALRDVTERVHTEEARERLLVELQDALSKVRTLSGLLPICAACKKIRDDQGYWNRIEDYLKSHSEVDFSHSICPECTEKLYPELYGPNGTHTRPRE
jgi:PAS domain-containing protein